MQSVVGQPVLVAGDPERAHIKKVQEKEGIYYHINLMEAMVMTVCIFDIIMTFVTLHLSLGYSGTKIKCETNETQTVTYTEFLS